MTKKSKEIDDTEAAREQVRAAYDAPTGGAASAFSPHPPFIPDLSEPRKLLESQADSIMAELNEALPDRGQVTQQVALLGRLAAFRRAADVLAGRFTVDGEELVDTEEQVPKFLGAPTIVLDTWHTETPEHKKAE